MSIPRTVAAHPFGDPQTVEVDRGGGPAEVVHVNWKVGAADDLTLLGIHLEVLPEDRVLLDGAIEYEKGDAKLVRDSDEVSTYLLDHISVSTAGDIKSAACTGKVTSAAIATDPVVSFSIGAPCVFRLGNTENRGRPWTDVELGTGNYIQESVILQAEVSVGENCSIHIGTLVGHETTIILGGDAGALA
mgnify:CR=1 FL=1